MRPDFDGARPRARGGDGLGDNTLAPDFASRSVARGGDGVGDNTLAPDFSSRPVAGGGLGDDLMAPDWDAEPLLGDAEIDRAARRNPQMYTRLVFDHRLISADELDSAAFAIAVAEQQQIHGLEVDGIVGPRTLAALGIPHGEAALPKQAEPSTRGVRNAEGAADRASGRALERDQALSIDEQRDTLPVGE